LAKALNETEEVDVKVLAVNQEEVKQDVPIEKVSVRRFPNELAYHQVKNQVEKRMEEYDVIQGQHSLTIPPLGLIEDKPTVGVIRDYWPICYQTTLRDNYGNNHLKCGWKCKLSTIQDFHILSPYKFFNHHLRQRITKKVDMLAPRSKFVEERLQEHGFKNTEVMYNFVPEGFDENVEPKGEGDILYVGKLEEQKGPQLLVDAIPEILEEESDQKFVFLGDGPMKEDLQKRVNDTGARQKVKFRGHVPMDEVKSRMKGAKTVVSPSLWHEPLSRVIIEAQALGTPVVTTERGGNKEITGLKNLIDVNEPNFNTKLKNLEILRTKLTKRKEVIGKWMHLYESLGN